MSTGNYYITGEYTGLDSSSPEVWMPMRLLQGFLKIPGALTRTSRIVEVFGGLHVEITWCRLHGSADG